MRSRELVPLTLALVLLAACGGGGESPPPNQGGADPGSGKATALTPESAARAVMLQNRGIGLLERYDYEPSIAPLRESLDLAPDWFPARLHLVLALMHAGPETRPEGRERVTRMLEEYPEDPHTLFAAALLAENAGDTEVALGIYERAYPASDNDPVVGAKLGTLLLGYDRADEALKLLEVVHAQAPALVSPVNSLMLLYRRDGQDGKSKEFLALLKALKGPLRDDMQQPRVGSEIAQAYGNMGKFSRALPRFAGPLGEEPVPDTAPVTAGTPVAIDGWKAGALSESSSVLGSVLLDYDDDGDLDLFVCGGSAPCALLRNDGGLKFTNIADAAGVAVTGAYAVASGELDVAPKPAQGRPGARKIRPDLLLLREGGVTLLVNQGDGTFADGTEASGLGADPGGARSVLLFDADHEGDLDVFLSGGDTNGNRLWANGGPARFTNVTESAGLKGDGSAYGPALVLDVDRDGDMDLFVTRPGSQPQVFMNDRLLRFKADESASPADVQAVHGAVTGDFDRDGWEDVVVCGEASATLLRGTPEGLSAQLIAGAPGGPAVDVDPRLVGVRDLVFANGTRVPGAWTGQAFDAAEPLFDAAGAPNLSAADLDGDGAEELLLVRPNEPVLFRQVNGERRGAPLVLDFQGLIRNDVQAGWSNLEGFGALVEIRSGSHWQMRRVGSPSGNGNAGASRLVFGLGDASQADFVRVEWPDAVQQAALDIPGGSGQPQLIVEEQRRPDSCPLLFSWDGERFAWVTDFIGAGGLGFMIAPGVYAEPDPTERVLIDSALVQPKNGELLFKLPEAMEEVVYLDRVRLLSIDHPADVSVLPDERFSGAPPFADGELRAHVGEILPTAASDHRGNDVLSRVLTVDRRYPQSAALHPRLIGVVEEKWLELDFADRLAGVAPGDPLTLCLNGWIEYGYTRTSVAAAGEGLEYLPPVLEAFVPGADGSAGTWKAIGADLGYPAGFARTMTYDVTGKVSRETPRLRIRTNMEIYWDRVWLAPRVPMEGRTKVTELAAKSANLRWVGYPREYSPDGRIPKIYDYQTLDPSMPWKTVTGNYTKFGSVLPLLDASDDMFVIYGKGEEIDLRFDAAALPALAEGWTRTYVLDFDGWCKGQEMYIANGYTVEPLPFHAMSHYPYGDGETYPETEAHREYRREWNTRRVGAPAKR